MVRHPISRSYINTLGINHDQVPKTIVGRKFESKFIRRICLREDDLFLYFTWYFLFYLLLQSQLHHIGVIYDTHTHDLGQHHQPQVGRLIKHS